MEKNKIMMGLVFASISAMAIAPSLKEELEKDNKDEDKSGIIKLSEISVIKELKTENTDLEKEYKDELEFLLSKKTPNIKLGKEINIVVDNYGEKEDSIKNELYNELNLSQDNSKPNAQDSTSGPVPSNAVVTTNDSQNYINKYTCHSACHGACHGSRSWR